MKKIFISIVLLLFLYPSLFAMQLAVSQSSHEVHNDEPIHIKKDCSEPLNPLIASLAKLEEQLIHIRSDAQSQTVKKILLKNKFHI